MDWKLFCRLKLLNYFGMTSPPISFWLSKEEHDPCVSQSPFCFILTLCRSAVWIKWTGIVGSYFCSTLKPFLPFPLENLGPQSQHSPSKHTASADCQSSRVVSAIHKKGKIKGFKQAGTTKGGKSKKKNKKCLCKLQS
jgi:hypothetical protein